MEVLKIVTFSCNRHLIDTDKLLHSIWKTLKSKFDIKIKFTLELYKIFITHMTLLSVCPRMRFFSFYNHKNFKLSLRVDLIFASCSSVYNSPLQSFTLMVTDHLSGLWFFKTVLNCSTASQTAPRFYFMLNSLSVHCVQTAQKCWTEPHAQTILAKSYLRWSTSLTEVAPA